MIKVGVIGIGMMGNTHLDVYARRSDVEVVAISDIIPERMSGKQRAAGNIEGQAQGNFDLSRARKHPEGMLLIADKEVELVDICLPTPLHADYAIAALRAGKHVLTEKPLARTLEQAERLVAEAERSDRLIMPAMCLHFWPGWPWLRDAIRGGTYGRVLAAQFRRVASHPGGPFYSDGAACGGAILDLHIHDVDFIQWCFGMPRAIRAFGHRRITSEIDHVIAHYDFGSDGPMVSAEGGWTMAPGFGFAMQYVVNFEQATAVYDLASKPALTLVRDGKREPVELAAGMGYEHEIAYFLDCIARNEKPSVVTVADAAKALRIVEAERRSIADAATVAVADG